MRMRLLMLLGLVCLPVTVTAQSVGEGWLRMTDHQRELFVFGYAQGYLPARVLAHVLISDFGPYSDNGERLVASLTPEQRKWVLEEQAAIDKVYGIAPFDIATVAATMTRLYEDPANRLIRYTMMIEVAISRLRGSSEAEVNRRLADMRRIVAEDADSE